MLTLKMKKAFYKPRLAQSLPLLDGAMLKMNQKLANQILKLSKTSELRLTSQKW
jgi:hypothetical protein